MIGEGLQFAGVGWLTLCGGYLSTLSLAALRPRRLTAPPTGARPRLAIVVPAHDEAHQVATCVASVRRAIAHEGQGVLFVVADNCTDETAAVASAAGAYVLERTDPARRGKAFALAHAFEELRDRAFDAFVIVDADSTVSENFVAAIADELLRGADLVQVAYDIGPSASGATDPRRRLMSLAFNAFNRLRPMGRAALGLSCGLAGNGWAVRRTVLDRVPPATDSHVEDLEQHVRLVLAGLTVRFVDGACVLGDTPAASPAAAAQRRRWEAGRLQVALRWAPRLALAVLRGRWRALEPLLELACPPLAYLLLAIVVAACVPGLRAGAFAAAAGLVVHAAALRTITDGERWRALAYVPRYVLWKLALLPQLLDVRASRRQWRAPAER